MVPHTQIVTDGKREQKLGDLALLAAGDEQDNEETKHVSRRNGYRAKRGAGRTQAGRTTSLTLSPQSRIHQKLTAT